MASDDERRLQVRIRELKRQINTQQDSAKRSPLPSSNPILAGDRSSPPKTLKPPPDFVPYYPLSRFRSMLEVQPFEPRSMSLLPQNVVLRALQEWDPRQEPHGHLRQLLLRVFVPKHAQFNIDVDLSALEERMQLLDSHPNSVHPCLSNAIFLGACSSSGPELVPFQSLFFSRAQLYLPQSLSKGDRVEDYFLAAIIIVWYFLRNGKIDAAHAQVRTLASMALACRLNHIDPFTDDPESEPGTTNLLGPPIDLSHKENRIRLFWSIYFIDVATSIVSGFAPSLRDEDITTPWPIPVNSIRPPTGTASETVSDLYRNGSASTTVTHDSILSLRVKAMALLCRTIWVVHLSETTAPDDKLYQSTFLSVENAISSFIHTIPDIPTFDRDVLILKPCPSCCLPSKIHSHKGLNPDCKVPLLILVHATIHAASITLHSIHAKDDEKEYRRVLASARAMARGAEILGGRLNILFSHICLGPHWYIASEVFIREIHRNNPPTTKLNGRCLASARRDLDVVVNGLGELTGFYPGLDVYIRRLRTLLMQRNQNAGTGLLMQDAMDITVGA